MSVQFPTIEETKLSSILSTLPLEYQQVTTDLSAISNNYRNDLSLQLSQSLNFEQSIIKKSLRIEKLVKRTLSAGEEMNLKLNKKLDSIKVDSRRNGDGSIKSKIDAGGVGGVETLSKDCMGKLWDILDMIKDLEEIRDIGDEFPILHRIFKKEEEFEVVGVDEILESRDDIVDANEGPTGEVRSTNTVNQSNDNTKDESNIVNQSNENAKDKSDETNKQIPDIVIDSNELIHEPINDDEDIPASVQVNEVETNEEESLQSHNVTDILPKESGEPGPSEDQVPEEISPEEVTSEDPVSSPEVSSSQPSPVNKDQEPLSDSKELESIERLITNYKQKRPPPSSVLPFRPISNGSSVVTATTTSSAQGKFNIGEASFENLKKFI